jgi:hypothetical protein
MENARLLAYRKLSDLALAAKARTGDAGALHTLIERHGPRVNRLASQLLGDFEDARDAAQESLVKLCTRSSSPGFIAWSSTRVATSMRGSVPAPPTRSRSRTSRPETNRIRREWR